MRVVAGDGEALGVHVLDVGQLDSSLSLPDELDELALTGGKPDLSSCISSKIIVMVEIDTRRDFRMRLVTTWMTSRCGMLRSRRTSRTKASILAV